MLASRAPAASEAALWLAALTCVFARARSESAASGVVVAVPVPDMPTPGLLELDAPSALLQAEIAEVAQRVAALREQVPNTLRDCAVSLQKTLRSAAASVAASAAGTTLSALQAAAPDSVADVVAAEAAAGALVPVEHAAAMTADLSESFASLPAVADRLQARTRRRVPCVARRLDLRMCTCCFCPLLTPQRRRTHSRKRWLACSAWWQR